MPNNTSRRKMRHCRDCGRPFAASNSTAEACADCQPTKSHRTKQRSSEPALAAAGARSSGEGEWITPPVMYSDDESSEAGETSGHDESSESEDSGSHDESSTPESPGKTKWRSPPITIQFAAPDEKDDPVVPTEKQPCRLKTVIKSAFVVATPVILAVGGGLICATVFPWLSGCRRKIKLKNSLLERPSKPARPTRSGEKRRFGTRETRNVSSNAQLPHPKTGNLARGTIRRLAQPSC